MTTASRQSRITSLVGRIGWPLLWGLALTVVFYGVVDKLTGLTPMRRCFTSHWAAYLATVLFFVTLAALAIRSLGCLQELLLMTRICLPEPPPQGQSLQEVPSLLAFLDQLPPKLKKSPVCDRLSAALKNTAKEGDPARLSAHLARLAERDAMKRKEGYLLPRISTWIIPLLGGLGTLFNWHDGTEGAASEIAKKVTDAIPDGMFTTLGPAMAGVLLSLLLFMARFVVEHVESQLARKTDERADHELTGRFAPVSENYELATSAPVLAVDWPGGIDRLLAQQAEAWRTFQADARSQWSEAIGRAENTLQQGAIASLDKTLAEHTTQIVQAHAAAAEKLKGVWEGLSRSILEHAQRMQAQQAELVRQGEVMNRVLETAGNVIRLERTLNENLKSLADEHHFEEAVMNLSAAAHLLTARVGSLPAAAAEPRRARVGRAAA